MQLQRFKVCHFRSLFRTSWIPFYELTVFTGQNDGGKTATLAALEIFLEPKAEPRPEDYSFHLCQPAVHENSASSAAETPEKYARENTITMWASFSLSAMEQELLDRHLELRRSEIIVKREFEAETDERSPYLIRRKAHKDRRFHVPLTSHKNDDLKAIAEEYDISLSGMTRKEQFVAALNEWVARQPDEDFLEVDFALPDEFTQRLPSMVVFASETADNPDHAISIVLRSQFRKIIQDREFAGRLKDLTADIETRLNNELDSLKPIIRAYTKDIRNVTIQPSFNFASGLSTTNLQLHRGDGTKVPLEQSGAGQRQRITLAIFEWQLALLQPKERDTENEDIDEQDAIVFAFDEPDTHLDYTSQRQILNLIHRYAKLESAQVIVCTHSLNFIERVPIERIVHYQLDAQRHTTCSTLLMLEDEIKTSETVAHELPGKRHQLTDLFLYRISENMGLRNSILLHERCFLIVEGAADHNAIPVLFHLRYDLSLQAAGICLLNGEGYSGAIKLAEFLNVNDRQVLFLLDRDVLLNAETQRVFTQRSLTDRHIDVDNQVFYVGEKEFEDAFPDGLWARVGNSHFPKRSGEVWQVDDIAPLRDHEKFSRSLQITFSRESGGSVTKPDMGYLAARMLQDPSEIPADITACLDAAYEIANPAAP